MEMLSGPAVPVMRRIPPETTGLGAAAATAAAALPAGGGTKWKESPPGRAAVATEFAGG